MKSVLIPRHKRISVEVRLLYCLNTRDGTCEQILVEQSLFNTSVQPPDSNKQGRYTRTWQLPSSLTRSVCQLLLPPLTLSSLLLSVPLISSLKNKTKSHWLSLSTHTELTILFPATLHADCICLSSAARPACSRSQLCFIRVPANSAKQFSHLKVPGH